MKIQLNTLRINNFKGIADFELDLQGKSATIAGQNGTGKSSIADAWYWLISGKDSEQQANFNVLTLDDQGRAIDHQDAEVSAELSVGKKKIALEKIFRQKWTKKRGSAEKELTGHTTDHFFDRVPVTQREYQDQLAEIIDDTLFRILSDVRFFPAATKMDDRRKMLLEISGDISDEEVIANNPELAELDSILSEREIEQHKKIITASRKLINEQLTAIPIRIDELKKSMNDISGYNRIALRQQVDDYDSRIADQVAELGKFASGINISELRKTAVSYETDLIMLDNDVREKNSQRVNAIMLRKTTLERDRNECESDLKKISSRIDAHEQTLITNEAIRADLIKKWALENSRRLVSTDLCFNCGQTLPDNKVAEQQDNFNVEKAATLKKINAQGERLYSDYNVLRREKEVLSYSLGNLHEKLDSIDRRKIPSINEEIHHINNENGIEYGKKHMEIQAKITEIHEKIEAMQQSSCPEKNALKTAIQALEDEKSVAESKLLEITHHEKTEKRIAELKKELKTYASEYEQTEKESLLIDEFTRKKAEFIEQNVSGHFAITKWKLFEEQVNGGLKDICEPCVNGVPYSSDLNYGHKILCGLDCISTISKHHKVSVPAFIDNAESLTDWIDFKHQHVRLLVSPGKEKLEVTNG